MLAFKRELLTKLARQQSYTLNVCRLNGVKQFEVRSSLETVLTDTPEGLAKVREKISAADLVLTCVGKKNLPALCATIASALNGARKHWVLLCENGFDLARQHGADLPPQAVLIDTVMSRMCRFAEPDEKDRYAPLWPGTNAALVVEDYAFLPLNGALSHGGPFSSAFSLVSAEEFLMWEHVKLFLHNGLHAFVAYHAHLAGIKRFCDVPAEIRDRAQEVALREVVPALLKTHTCARPEMLKEYAQSLLKRFFNPYLNDSIDRGIRGLEEKLMPGERLMGGCEFIRRAGIEPRGYASTVEAAKKILARRQG
jgi:mannitol-1-phosphate/altronate dehydrogenase